MEIVILDGYAANPGDLNWDGLKKFGNLTVYDRTPAEEIIPRAKNAEAIFLNKTPLRAETLEKLPKCRFIGVLATGYDVVDVIKAKELGIVVSNVPAYSTDSIAQLTFALILELTHRVAQHSEGVHKLRWSSCQDFCYWDMPLMELSGLTLGLIGFGRIGRAVAKIANAFNMKVLVYTRTQKPVDGLDISYVTLGELLKNSDIVSLHCPLTNETQGIINKNTIALMKDGAFLINTARGKAIVEQDVFDALESGKLGGAGMDVLSTEPPKPDNILLKAKNTFITPHMGWGTFASRKRLMATTVANLEAFMNGAPINVVNK